MGPMPWAARLRPKVRQAAPYETDQGRQAANVYLILQVGHRVVLLFVFEHKHFTMPVARLILISIG